MCVCRSEVCKLAPVCACRNVARQSRQERQTKQRSRRALCDELSPLESHFQGLNLISGRDVDAEMENDEEKKSTGSGRGVKERRKSQRRRRI